MFTANASPDNSGQYQKAERFKKLHTAGSSFVMPNPWDRGTAILMQNAGFKAIGTTSAGLAFSLGKLDRAQSVTLEETLENARDLVEATQLPVSIDLEDGFGESADAIMQTIRAAANSGAVGGSIEDYSSDLAHPIRDFAISVARVEAAVEAAKRLPFPFTVTARAENFLYGVHDLKDTLAHLLAEYQKTRADAPPRLLILNALCHNAQREALGESDDAAFTLTPWQRRLAPLCDVKVRELKEQIRLRAHQHPEVEPESQILPGLTCHGMEPPPGRPDGPGTAS